MITKMDGKKQIVPAYSPKDKILWSIYVIMSFIYTGFLIWLFNNFENLSNLIK